MANHSMRQPQNAKRGRGRNRRGPPQPTAPNRNTAYESNGPDVKLRGNAQQLNEKYLALAHDAAAAGERITAEAYTQYADHYYRLYQAAVDAAEERKPPAPPMGVSSPARPSQPAISQPTVSSSHTANIPAPPSSASGNGQAMGAGVAPTRTPRTRRPANTDDGAGQETPSPGAQVVDLTPAKISEIVQDDQDSRDAS